jgi:predicted RNA-binding Zn-ribbon protein involved in translation (DUF1610 family)
MDERKRYCKHCGAEIIIDSKYCSRCGTGLNSAGSPVSQPQKTSRKGFFAFGRKDNVKKANIVSKIPKTKTITETRYTCNVCGKIWHYGKQEQTQNVANAMQNLGKGMMCCTGCLPAVFLPDKKVVDLNKCPNCGSKNIKKEIIAHAVAR